MVILLVAGGGPREEEQNQDSLTGPGWGSNSSCVYAFHVSGFTSITPFNSPNDTHGREIINIYAQQRASQVELVVKAPPASAGDTGVGV